MDDLAAPVGLWDVASSKRALDIVWPLIYVTTLLAVFIVWYTRLAEIEFAPIAWLVCAAISGYVLLSWILDIADRPRITAAGMLTAHFLGVLVLGVIWVRLGSLRAPGFLLFFALPVLAGGILLARWGRPLTVCMTIAVVLVAAALQSPALRWYAEQFGLPLVWLEAPASWLRGSGNQPMSSAGPGLTLVSLFLSGTALVAIDVCAEKLTLWPRQLLERMRRMIGALRQSEELALELMQSGPLPEAVVFADSGQIMLTNDRFRTTFGFDDTEAGPRGLFDVVRFRFPEALQALVREQGGNVECSYSGADGRPHSAIAHVRLTRLRGERIARITLENRSTEHRLAAALDALDDVVIITDAADLVVHANPTARLLFPEATPGAPAATVLERPDLPHEWWHAPPESTVPRHLVHAGQELRGHVVHRAANSHVGATTVITLARKERE